MKVAFNKKHFIAIGIIFLLIIGSAVLVRTLYIAPEIQAKELAENNLQMEKELIKNLNQKLRVGIPTIHETSFSLQKKVPVDALLDQFLLDISRAEALSESLILYMDIEDQEVTSAEDLIFSSEDKEKAEEEEASEKDEANEEPSEAEETSAEQESAVENTATQNFDVEGLRKLTATVFLQAVNYESLSRFLQEIDRLPRIINIESIYFNDPTGELIDFDQQIRELNFEVKISTFYQPTLEDLKGDNPTFDHERPANKETPFFDN